MIDTLETSPSYFCSRELGHYFMYYFFIGQTVCERLQDIGFPSAFNEMQNVHIMTFDHGLEYRCYLIG